MGKAMQGANRIIYLRQKRWETRGRANEVKKERGRERKIKLWVNMKRKSLINVCEGG